MTDHEWAMEAARAAFKGMHSLTDACRAYHARMVASTGEALELDAAAARAALSHKPREPVETSPEPHPDRPWMESATERLARELHEQGLRESAPSPGTTEPESWPPPGLLKSMRWHAAARALERLRYALDNDWDFFCGEFMALVQATSKESNDD